MVSCVESVSPKHLPPCQRREVIPFRLEGHTETWSLQRAYAHFSGADIQEQFTTAPSVEGGVMPQNEFLLSPAEVTQTESVVVAVAFGVGDV